MHIGLVFPQTEFGHDAGALKDYTQTAEALGYSHILAYDHILGANPDRPGGWRGPYTYRESFLEPFVLFSYMAALATSLSFTTGILILPQRETALVAKQAATLDAISGGRLRLGVGTGWNEVEYEAMGQDFHTRGRRQEEQVILLRRLWTEELVTFKGEFDDIPDAGLNPLPAQRPIPIWFGGHADAVLERIARLGDGWYPQFRSAEKAADHLAKLDEFLAANGRTRSDIGIEPRVNWKDGAPEQLVAVLRDWQKVGANYASLNTMGAGLATPADHIAAIHKFAAVALP